MVGPQLQAFVRSHRDYSLRRIDIGSWSSPVAKQYHINSIPHLRLYNANGRIESQGTDNVLAKIGIVR